jgi:hypothetical protein
MRPHRRLPRFFSKTIADVGEILAIARTSATNPFSADDDQH